MVSERAARSRKTALGALRPEIDDLESNLKSTVKWIEDKTNVELLAIGIGHDVTRYYKKAVKITDVQDLGDVMINQLTDLFKDDKRVLN